MLKKKIAKVRNVVTFDKINYSAETEVQKEFLRKIRNSICSFAIGSPGTGKTFLAVCVGLDMLLKGQVKKIILTRPTVSSGPEIGFLPGDENDKLAPFLVPLFDAINKVMPKYLTDQYIEDKKIEILSLAFARGRNFEDAFVIVDEAENLDRKSFYLLLTRICEGSKMVFCGDSFQTDLRINESGLDDAVRRLENRPDFSVTRFTSVDCRRSRIVKEVIDAYQGEERREKREEVIEAFNPKARRVS